MPSPAPVDLGPVAAQDPPVLDLLTRLTQELADGGYTAAQTFGYSPEQLERAGVHLIGVRVNGRLVGVGGVEVQGDGMAELKRFFVERSHRGTGVADALLSALVAYARAHDVRTLRLETGDKQAAARAFYRRHGFLEVERFSPYEASSTSVCMQRAV